RIWRRTKTAPTKTSGTASGSARCTAPTRTPMATANAAGRTPRRRRTTHHSVARPGAALGKTEKNFHSLRPPRRSSTGRFCPKSVAAEHELHDRRGDDDEDDDRNLPGELAGEDGPAVEADALRLRRHLLAGRADAARRGGIAAADGARHRRRLRVAA